MTNKFKAITNAIGFMLVLIASPFTLTFCGFNGRMTQTKLMRVTEKTLEEKIRRTVRDQECLQQ